jgi:hypothetical protein
MLIKKSVNVSYRETLEDNFISNKHGQKNVF